MQTRTGAWLGPALSLLLAACATVPEAERQAERTTAGPPPVAARAEAASPPAVAEPPAAEPSGPAPAPVPKSQPPAAPPGPRVPPAVPPAPPPPASTPPAVTVAPPVPEPPAAPAAAATPGVFTVAAGPKDPSHPFYGVGSRLGFIVDGVPGKPLILVRGRTYTFKVDTGVQHDFYFSTSERGWGAAAYTQGVQGQFIYKGVATFTPGPETPDLLYYQCRNHKNMGGAIYVVDEGEEGKSLAELQAEVGGGGPAPARQPARAAVSEGQVRQKIQFAEMFIRQSSTAKRIRGSGHAQARDTYRLAETKLDASRQALAGGRPAEALALVDEAVRLMSEAGRLVPATDQTEAEGQRARYEELLEGTRTFEASYARNYKRMADQGRKNLPVVDLDAIHAAMERASALAGNGEYAEAIGVLTEAQATLTTALTRMLADESISYELVFETPKEEYEYELARYLSYEELVPIAIEQKQPAPQTIELMNQFVEKAKSIKKLSEPEAEKGNYKDAILMLQGATSHIQRALRIVGVR